MSQCCKLSLSLKQIWSDAILNKTGNSCSKQARNPDLYLKRFQCRASSVRQRACDIIAWGHFSGVSRPQQSTPRRFVGYLKVPIIGWMFLIDRIHILSTALDYMEMRWHIRLPSLETHPRSHAHWGIHPHTKYKERFIDQHTHARTHRHKRVPTTMNTSSHEHRPFTHQILLRKLSPWTHRAVDTSDRGHIGGRAHRNAASLPPTFHKFL